MSYKPYMSGEIGQASWVWKLDDGTAWLVSFDLTEIDGRLECVGMSVRSYMRRTITDEKGFPHVQAVVGPIEPGTKAWGEIAGEDQAAAIETEAYRDLAEPRVLDAQTMRKLPFHDVLTRARRQKSGFLRAIQEIVGETAARLGFEDAAAAIEPPSGLARLHLAAALYTVALKNGEPPTKSVAESLGVSRNVAAKLIQQCRAPEIALLAPTEKGKAGGILPTDRDPKEAP